MSEHGKSHDDLASVWREQPEQRPIKLEMRRRTQQLYASTESEILVSIGAAIFFIAVMLWYEPELIQRRVTQFGFIAVLVWVLISVLLLLKEVRRAKAVRHDVAVSGIEYYRKSLERRRDHLKNAWVWHGPLFLACIVSIAIVFTTRFPVYRGFKQVLPLIVVLAIWTVFAVVRRLRQARALQRELDEIETS